jgi:hypothetical protein
MMDWEAAKEPRSGAADRRLDEPTRLSLGMVASPQSPLLFHLARAPPRGLLKRERHCLEIEGRFVCLLQEVYAEIPLKEPAGSCRVCQQDIRRTEDYRETPDAHPSRPRISSICKLCIECATGWWLDERVLKYPDCT